MVKRVVLALFAASSLCGCEALIAASILAEVAGDSLNDPGGFQGGGFDGSYFGSANIIPSQDGYMQGRVARVSVDSPTDVLEAAGGPGWLDVYSEVRRANGGAVMTIVTFYGDEDSLDPEQGQFTIESAWGTDLIGCSGPSSGNWTNEATLEDIQIETRDTIVIDDAGEEVPATEVEYQADFRDWGGDAYQLDGQFTLTQP